MATEPHVLLVDDERDIRDPLAFYLSKNGFRVTKAEDAAAARAILAFNLAPKVEGEAVMVHAVPGPNRRLTTDIRLDAEP